MIKIVVNLESYNYLFVGFLLKYKNCGFYKNCRNLYTKMNPYHRSSSRTRNSGESINSAEDNPFVSNEVKSNKPIFLAAHSFMKYSNPTTISTKEEEESPTKLNEKFESIRIPFSSMKANSILSLPIGGETAFKSAIEEPEDEYKNNYAEYADAYAEPKNNELEIKDEGKFGIELKDNKIEKKINFKFNLVIILMLLVLIILTTVLSSFPVFTCNDSNRICLPQLTIKLTDKSSAAKTALLTVREALKVLSYLAIDFGDNDNEIINKSLDSYYENKVIDAFSVNTIYELNFLGYCRLTNKDLKYFCMKSYGFDLLSVFVRDAGVQLGELTKTNLSIMGDSFAIAYELAINGFNKLVNKEGGNNEYINWAILLEKFSKGLGFLSLTQFIFDNILILLIILILAGIKYNFNKLIKVNILIITIIGFLNLLNSFLISSLTLEYILKLKELSESVGIADVTTGWGFVMIWISFLFHSIELIFIILIANLYRKEILY